MAVDKIQMNMFQQPLSPVKAVKTGKPQGTKAVEGGMNPFAPNQKSENGMGVGLVNSSLEGLSYTLPNGKHSRCNTIGIA